MKIIPPVDTALAVVGRDAKHGHVSRSVVKAVNETLRIPAAVVERSLNFEEGKLTNILGSKLNQLG